MARPYREQTPNIREWRFVRGMTQELLAERVGVRQATISDIERGQNYPSHETLRRISKALQVPVDLLFTDPLQQLRAQLRQRQ